MNPMIKIDSKPSLQLLENGEKFENFESFLSQSETILAKIKPVLSCYDMLIVDC